MKFESKVWSPLWLEYSGIPQLLARKIKGGAGWPVFKKLVEVDCALNSEPGTVEISMLELADRSGVTAAAARKAISAMRKLRMVACFLPDSDEESALLKVRTPLETPLNIDELKLRHPRLFLETPQAFRYVENFELQSEDAEASDPLLQEIVDLYFGTVGLKMNAFVLDELKLVRQRFPADAIRRTFRRAQQNEIRSLHWIVQELVRQKKAHDEENSS